MADRGDKMKKFEFLIGTWDLEYRVPESPFSRAERGTGKGTFRRALGKPETILEVIFTRQ